MCIFLIFILALVAVDTQGNENVNDHNSISSDDSTINIMSSGEESVDVTNDFDPVESWDPNVTEISSSVSTHELVSNLLLLLSYK